jgi:hypothetical protein
MRCFALALLACLPASMTLAQTPAPAPAPPLFATTKVEGTDNVYIFRYQGHQAMFVVTPAGVIATDPIGRYRPQAVTTYIDEIRKITSAPIRYVVYSHHHYDHIAGGKPFKDAGATFVAHKRAKDRLAELNFPDVTPVDETVDDKRVIELGGTTLELIYVGRNHSDNTLLMRLAEGETDLRGRLPADQFGQLAQHAGQLAVRVGGRHQKSTFARMGPHDPGSSGPGRTARHARRREHPALLHAGACRRSEEGGRCRQVHRHRDARGEAAEIRDADQLRELAADERRALLPVLFGRHVSLIHVVASEQGLTSISASVTALEPISGQSASAMP